MRLIDADKIHPDVRTQHGALAISQGQLAYAKTVNAIPIPDGATNGDTIMAMFPNARVSQVFPSFNNDEVYYVFVEKVNSITIEMRVMKSWWNAPYKRER